MIIELLAISNHLSCKSLFDSLLIAVATLLATLLLVEFPSTVQDEILVRVLFGEMHGETL